MDVGGVLTLERNSAVRCDTRSVYCIAMMIQASTYSHLDGRRPVLAEIVQDIACFLADYAKQNFAKHCVCHCLDTLNVNSLYPHRVSLVPPPPAACHRSRPAPLVNYRRDAAMI